MREIMVLSMADFRIMDATAKDLSRSATWSEQKCAGKRRKPGAAICTIEFNRIVWNTLALLKPLLKTEKGRVSINIKVDLDPGGTGFTRWSEFINLKCWIQTFIIDLMCAGLYLFAWISEREWNETKVAAQGGSHCWWCLSLHSSPAVRLTMATITNRMSNTWF